MENTIESVAKRAKMAAKSGYKNSVVAYHATKERGNFYVWNLAFDREIGINHPPKANYERRNAT